jgi:hypothetical protein
MLLGPDRGPRFLTLQRSPKKIYRMFRSSSVEFLPCPGNQGIGDPLFEKNFTEKECENYLIPGTDCKIFSFHENYTAIGVCLKNYRGILSTVFELGFG